MSLSNHFNPHVQANERLDVFLDGKIRVIQSKRGYRFSMDALLLAEFASVKSGDRVVDLGTGCGIILLALLTTSPAAFAVGVEIQEHLASQAGRNAVLNGLDARMVVVRGDLRRPPLRQGIWDLVVCNPPYRKAQSGRINPDPERAVARHEILADIGDILAAARLLLKAKGRLAMVYPCSRMADLIVRMRSIGLEPKRIQMVHPNISSEAKLALVEASWGGRPGVSILPPVLDQGPYSLP